MKKILVAVIIVVVLAAAVACWLLATASRHSAGITFPLPPRQRALAAAVPATADAFALIPGVAGVEEKLRANPVTRDLVDRFENAHPLPWRWILGDADLVAWRTGKQTTYLLQLEPVRALLARGWLAVAGSDDRVLLDAPEGERRPAAEIDKVLALAASLPPGDALVVQFEGGRGAFPPIGRPAVSSVAVTAPRIDIVSRAARSDEAGAASPAPPLHARFPLGAMITAVFASPPRVVDDMNRLVGAKASPLLRDGGTLAIYDIDSGKLLPRPHEVIAVPRTPERQVALQQLLDETLGHGVAETLGVRVQSAEVRDELAVAFDDTSIEKYRNDSFVAGELPASSWALRIDPRRAGPVLERLSGNPGLRYLAPRVNRSVRDVAGWIGPLGKATGIEAGATEGGGVEELRVRVSSK